MDQAHRIQKWAASEEDFRLILDLAPDPIGGVDLDGRCTFCNAALLRMLGFKREEELLGRDLHALIHHTRADGASLEPEACPVLWPPLHGRSASGKGERFWRTDGSCFPADFWSYPLYQNGTLEGAVITFSDPAGTYPRPEAQAQEPVARLASGIARELNTPIQFLGVNLGFLRKAHERLSRLLNLHREAMHFYPEAVAARLKSAEAGLDLEFIEAETPSVLAETDEGMARVARIAGAIGGLSSQVSGAAKVGVDVNGGLEAAATVTRNEWKYVADLVLDLEENLPLVPGHPSALNKAFLELVVNAAQAVAGCRLPEGRLGTITLATRSREGGVEVRVTDTGTGIPPELQGRVFEPFFSTRGGSGQGLAFCRRTVVDLHGGTIHFETRPGEGTTFVVQLPLPASPERGPHVA